MMERRIAGMLGICRKAVKMKVGTELTLNAVRARKDFPLVLIAADASENTNKKIRNCCEYYGSPHETLPLTADRLGNCVGKKGCVAAVGIEDGAFASAILKLMKGQGDCDI